MRFKIKSPRAGAKRFVLLALAAALARPAAAQRIEDVRVGTMVRIRYGTPTVAAIEGTLLSADTIEVAVQTGGRNVALQRVPFSEITRFDLSAGLRTASAARKRGAWRGAYVGLGLTAAMLGTTRFTGGKWGAPCKIRIYNPCFLGDYRSATLVGAQVTGLAAIVGAAIGNRHRERWSRLQLPWANASP